MNEEQFIPLSVLDDAKADAKDIAATLRGNSDAYRRLIERHQSAIALQMRRFSRDPAVIEELTHDVFVEAYLSLRGYRGPLPWLHWLRKVAVRVGYRYWKRNRNQSTTIRLSEKDWQQIRESAPELGSAAEAAELTHALLAQLAPADRLVLTLLYLDGCSIAEAATRAGWTVPGTKIRAFRARNRLKALLEQNQI